MKKVLITLLVLGLASVANADLLLAVDGVEAPAQIMANPGDVINLGVLGTGTNPASVAPWVIVQGDLSLSGSNVLYTGALAGYQELEEVATDYGMAPQELLDLFGSDFGYPGVKDAGSMIFGDTGTGAGGSLVPITGLLVGDIGLGVSGAGLVSLIDDNFQVVSSMEVIPEPMTIALLGLGGLFLRRRK